MCYCFWSILRLGSAGITATFNIIKKFKINILIIVLTYLSLNLLIEQNEQIIEQNEQIIYHIITDID